MVKSHHSCEYEGKLKIGLFAALFVEIGDSLPLYPELSHPSQVPDVAIAASVFGAIVIILICIGIAIIVVMHLRRQQHAKKVDLTRYAVLLRANFPHTQPSNLS